MTSPTPNRPTECSHPAEFDWPSPETIECPFPFYAALRRESPAFKPAGADYYLVSRHQDIAYVTTHPEIFSSEWPERMIKEWPQMWEVDESFGYKPTTMAVSDGADHKRKRALVLPLVRGDRMRAYEPMVRQMVNDLIDEFIEDGEVEFLEQFAGVLPVWVISELLGLPRDDFDKFKRWGTHQGPGSRFLSAERQAQQMAEAVEAGTYLAQAIMERQENPRDDLMSEYIRAQVERDGQFNLMYLIQEMNVVLFAGNVTTSHMMTSALTLLLQHPEQLDKVVNDRALLDPLLDEALRMESPVQWLPRYAAQDAEIDGVPIPAGSELFVMYASGNRDEARFDAPDRFDIERPGVGKYHVAFGMGNHRCLGAPLARLEGISAFDVFFDRVRNLRLAEGRNTFTHLDSPTFRAPQRLHLTFEPAARLR